MKACFLAILSLKPLRQILRNQYQSLLKKLSCVIFEISGSAGAQPDEHRLGLEAPKDTGLAFVAPGVFFGHHGGSF